MLKPSQFAKFLKNKPPFGSNGRHPNEFPPFFPPFRRKRTPRKVTIIDLHRLCKKGDIKKVAEVLDHLGQQGIRPNYETYIRILRRCIGANSLECGRLIHSCLMRTAVTLDLFLWNTILSMYIKCGGFHEASKMFDKMPRRNVVSWTAMISGCVATGHGNDGLRYFGMMMKDGVEPNGNTFATVIKICSELRNGTFGRALHGLVMKRGFDSDVFISSSMISLYASLECVSDARQVFDVIPERDVVSWNAMVAAYVQSGFGREALGLFSVMLIGDVWPNNYTVASIMKACAALSCVTAGSSVHGYVIKFGFGSDVFVMDCTLDMYLKCCCLDEARRTFDGIGDRDIVAWNTLISGYVLNGDDEGALQLFRIMPFEGVVPNQITFTSILKVVPSLDDASQCRSLHSQVIKCGFISDVLVGTALVDAYARSLSTDDAWKVYREMRKRNLASCNALITGFSLRGEYKNALKVYLEMQKIHMRPDPITFTGLLSSCSVAKAVAEGGQLHAEAIKVGLDFNVSVGNALSDLYLIRDNTSRLE